MRHFRPIATTLLTWLLLLGQPSEALSQWNDESGRAVAQLRIDTWSTDEGLLQHDVSAIHQSRDGFLWIGTREALVRFDGIRFRVYDRLNSPLPTGHITALYEDRGGHLWIGTAGGGLVLHRHGEFSTFTADDGLSSNSVTSIVEDQAGTFWVGTRDAGITLLRDGNVAHIGISEGLPHVHVTTMTSTSDGSVWIGAPGGILSRYADGQIELFPTRDGTLGHDVAAILEADDGGLWVGTQGGGLLHFDHERFERFTTHHGLPSDHVLALTRDGDGNLWIGTDHGGLARLDGSRFTTLTVDDGLAYDVVSALFTDENGDVWAGTSAGLNRIGRSRFSTYTTRDGLPHNTIYSVFEDEHGTLWIATDGGVARVRGESVTTLTTANGLSSNHALAINGTRDGSVWIGTYGGGLNRFHNDRLTTFTTQNGLPGDQIFALFEDRQGNLWIGTRNGLARYSDGDFTTFTRSDGLTSNDVTAITEDADGGIWVGTYDAGLSRLLDGVVVDTFSSRNGLRSDHILSLFTDDEGTLWIGTREGGLARFKNSQFVSITMQDGLRSNRIFQILEDARGFLWMSSNRGLFRVDRAHLNAFADGRADRVTSITYDRGDGLPGLEFNGGFQPAGWHARDGRLWFPTSRGVVAVRPPSSSDAIPTARVVVEHVTADEETFDLSRPVEIPAGRSRFRFDYAGVTFLAPEQIQFRYRLDGVDEGWILAGSRREAYYTNLSPGRYTFRVQASDADGRWSGDEATAELQLRPFIYQMPLFQLLCVMVVALLIILAFRLHVQRMRTRQEELLDLIDLHTGHLREEKEKTEQALLETDRARYEAERQKDIAQRAREVIEEQASRLRELDRIKTRFFSNVSHEFRTPLTLTIGPLENVLAGVYGDVMPETRAQIDLALRNARRLLRLINQLLDLSKLESGKMELSITRSNVVPIVEGVMLSFTAFAERKDLSLTFSSVSEDVSFFFDVSCIEKIFFNLISNAVKFTPEGGNVWVSVEEGPARLQGRFQEAVMIRIRDTGVGIPDEELPHIFDRFHQVDGAVGHVHEGTGIGLSLVKELVELHEGTITVFSEPGKGSEFIITLPKGLSRFQNHPVARDAPANGRPDVSRGPMMEMAVLDAWDDGQGDVAREVSAVQPSDVGRRRRASHETGTGFHAPSAGGTSVPSIVERAGRKAPEIAAPTTVLSPVESPASPATEPASETEADPGLSRPGALDSSDATKRRILIADDNPDVVDYVASLLARHYGVISARDGREALEKTVQERPDLIISDVMMPVMDGYALCRELKSDERLRHIPVILLTARASQDDRIEGLEAGSDDYIAKPFSGPELLARIRNLLVVREQQRRLAALNEELAVKNDELEEAGELKTQLLSIAAHDMKNPLNAIREFAKILKRELGEDSHVYDPIDLIQRSSDQMLHLVSSLLESSALETGKLVLETEPVNVNTLAAAIVRRNAKLAENKGQALELSISADRSLVKADKGRLLEAMDNLVNNAVKYSPCDKTIWISVDRSDSSVHFSVRDEGPGLTESDKRKLFGKFQRLSAQPTGGESSTGLGLAIVKQIVEMFDGRVLVESEAGSGSTFTLEMPILSDVDH